MKVGRACRCVKFSASPTDLLAFSEHQGAVHVVDARTYAHTQSVPLELAGGALDVGGLAFAPSGCHMYVGMPEVGVAEYDVDVSSRVCFADGSLI
jgi:hypothetical protein